MTVLLSCRARWVVLAFGFAAILGGCAPSVTTPQPTTRVETRPVGPLAYRPMTAGASWTYLPNGTPLESPTVRLEVEGPTVLDGEVRTAWHLEGRGLDVRWYREHRDDGTYLVREERPGTVITFDPPILEWTSRPLAVGQRWEGQTLATVRFPDVREEDATRTLEVAYATTVVDQRTVQVPAGEFEVFIVNFTSRTFDAEGNETESLTQETWVAPFLGEVRTENGFFLVDSNLLGLQPDR